ncbi:MAG TPA: efflux RND transporter periplasmic adaptor subunit [Gammaproteobacteria bacterium]|jgi:RND family efflux transporter MFP subunit|nr:efflux RND transporter periplasmic adaptor subunit [Xanthomonadales bacterium]HOP23350.1 efflux RND transporter periplasmic adaptor subunit [Gammaproteobacteria bacterium]HPQ88245.1 efflux RND transporter periplasmic adaptor subunit [Gammaproteobacteria bacterium]
MKKIVKIFIPLSILVGSVFAVQALVASKPPIEKKPKEQRVVSLFVDEVKAETVNLSVSTYGEVNPKTEIDLTSMVSGQVVEISNQFAEGGIFTKGDVLMKIDDTEYQAAVTRAKANVASAKVKVEEEIANSKIKEDQWKRKGHANPSDYALNIPQIKEAKALLEAAQADLKNAELNLQRTQVKAPFDGRVLSESIGLGQYISANTVLGHIFATDVVEVKMPLTDSQLQELNLPIGFVANIDNAPKVTFTAKNSKESSQWDGKIVRTQAAIDNQTRLIYAIAEITNPYNTNETSSMPMAVGLYVDANIQSKKSQDTLVFPRVALHNNEKVYVINDDEELEIRKVEVLSTSADLVHVSNGVKAGEKVVVSTTPTVIDGMKVKAISRDEELQAQAVLSHSEKQG